jgi:chromosomal replication initiator protein
MTPELMNDDLQATEASWGRVRSELLRSLGKDAFHNWIDPLVFRSARHGVIEFEAPTSFIGTWVERNYGETIRRLFARDGVNVGRLRFGVAARRCRRSRPPASARGRQRQSPASASGEPDAELPLAPLDSRFTFETFVVGKPNELAYSAAYRVAEGGPVSFNPLFLYGGVGLGKTHLMHAIAWEVRQNNPEARVLYLSAEQFMHRFISALRCKEIHSFKELFRSVDMLMVDDVQFIAGKDSTQDEFFHTFNALIDQSKQIVISADRAPGEIDGLEERIKSRLAWGLVVDLHPTDYELRLGILQSKAEAQAALNPGLTIGVGRDRVPRAPDQLERPGARGGADAALRLLDPRGARDHARHGAGMPRRHPARLRAQGHDRRDHPQGRGPLQPADV